LRAGAAIADLTVYEPGMPMLGWGIQSNTSEGVHTPLRARTFVVDAPSAGRRVAIVVCDLLMVSDALRLGVLEMLRVSHPSVGVDTHGLVMLATHTHSGPAGFSDHFVYNLPNPGFSPRVFRHLATAIAASIAEAASRLEAAELRWGEATVPLTAPVAFNRTVEAYNANTDVEPMTWATRAKAVDRRLRLLRIDALDGRPIGALSWFATHGTCVHSDNTLLHPDHKGLASVGLQAAIERATGSSCVCAFAQGAAGDVSPNHRWNARRGRMVGACDDDFAWAQQVADVQVEVALKAWHAAAAVPPEPPTIDAHAMHLDFRGYEASLAYTGGVRGCRTGESWLGVTFLEGTKEGGGPLLHAPWVAGLARKAVVELAAWRARLPGGPSPDWDLVQAPKYPFLQSGRGRRGAAFGLFDAARPALPGGADFVVAATKRFERIESIGEHPWTPNVVTVQLVRLGGVAVVGVPGEPTTVAGARIEAATQRRLEADGVRSVVCAGYANGYAGYVTTHEEYALQRYEGASTLFGRWTLAVIQTHVDAIVAALRAPLDVRAAAVGPPLQVASPMERYGQLWPGRTWVEANRSR